MTTGMSGDRPADAAGDVPADAAGGADGGAAGFASWLRDFHIECGAPTYRSLVAVSRRLPELYPDRLRGRDLPALSVTAISEVLGGKRVNLPAVGWVVVFVLSCQRRAYETCVLPVDPGPQVLPEWVELLRQARTAGGASGNRTP